MSDSCRKYRHCHHDWSFAPSKDGSYVEQMCTECGCRRLTLGDLSPEMLGGPKITKAR